LNLWRKQIAGGAGGRKQIAGGAGGGGGGGGGIGGGSHEKTCESRVATQNISKKDQILKILGVKRRWLLQLYWYKVYVLHTFQYHLMEVR